MLARLEISSASPAGEVPAVDLEGWRTSATSPPRRHRRQPGPGPGARRAARRPVRLGDAVQQVSWRDSGVEVRTASGSVAEAGRCVLAIPAASSADRVRARAAGRRARCPRAVRYGPAAKLFVPLAEPAPPERGHERARALVVLDPDRRERGPRPARQLLRRLRGGAGAARVDEGPGRWLESLNALRPDLALEPDRRRLSTWDDDPWAGAAYSISSTPEQPPRWSSQSVAFASPASTLAVPSWP